MSAEPSIDEDRTARVVEARYERRFGDCLELLPARDGRRTWERDAVVLDGFYGEAQAAGALRSDATLHLIDLAPGDGERAWQLLRVLGERWPALSVIAVCADTAAVVRLREHPSLGPLLAAGRLRVMCQPCDEAGWRAQLGRPCNPVAILAHGVFSSLRHDLRACHYGKWLEAWTIAGSESLEWRACAEREALAEIYCRGASSAAFLVPTGACTMLTPLLQVCDRRYLLLTSDHGVERFADIRLGALAAGVDALAEPALPVNFHALAEWFRAQGALCGTALDADCEAGTWPRVWQLAAQDSAYPALAERVTAQFDGTLGDLPASETWRAFMKNYAGCLATGQATADHAFVIWRASGFAPEALCALASGLIAQAERLDTAIRVRWRAALEKCCAQYYPPREDDGFLEAAAQLAAILGSWGRVCALLGDANTLFGITPDALRMYAWSLQACGFTRQALDLLEAARGSFVEEAWLASDADSLRARLADWHALAWYDQNQASDGELLLEPICESHAEAYREQFRDRQIAMMTRLPDLHDDAATAAWIAERRAEAGRIEFALIHRVYGFAGLLSAHQLGDSAFFHFWIGTDFQGQGFARPALKLLASQLARVGVRRMFSAVYPDNFRSLHTLRRAGCVVLPARALPPEQDMLFVCLALGETRDSPAALAEVLRAYSARTGGVFEFSPAEVAQFPLCWQGKTDVEDVCGSDQFNRGRR